MNGSVCAEVLATASEGVIRDGEELAALHPHITVIRPCTKAGLQTGKYFAVKDRTSN